MHGRAHRFLMLVIGIWIAGRIGASILLPAKDHGQTIVKWPIHLASETQQEFQPPRIVVSDVVAKRSGIVDYRGDWRNAGRTAVFPAEPNRRHFTRQASFNVANNGGNVLPNASAKGWPVPSAVQAPAATQNPLAVPESAAPAKFSPTLRGPYDLAIQRWSLTATSYWRSGSEASPTVGPGGAARLGGSQSAVRLAYLIEPRHSLRAYVRVAHTPGRRDGADIAVGIALRPIRSFPVDMHVERRRVVAGFGRDTTLGYIAGGVDNRQLPYGFRLSAYGQAGVADYGELVGFADAAVVVQRDVASVGGMRLSLGSVVAAAAQPGAQRIDVGPRVTVALPDVGQGAQIMLDWRERVAGNARPGSGLALTLAADF
jgi:hypothetical protein